MHASLAVAPEGLPLGVGAVKVWSRAEFKGPDALERKLNRTRIPIEAKKSVRWLDTLRQSTELIGAPGRCIHAGCRESDLCELFCLAREPGTNVLVRGRARSPGRGRRHHHRARDARRRAPSGAHRIGFRDPPGRERDAQLSVRFATLTVRRACREAAALRPPAAAGHPRPRRSTRRRTGRRRGGS